MTKIKRVLSLFILAAIVTAFLSCNFGNTQPIKQYLNYWSEAVTIGRLEVASETTVSMAGDLGWELEVGTVESGSTSVGIWAKVGDLQSYTVALSTIMFLLQSVSSSAYEAGYQLHLAELNYQTY